MAMIVIHTTQGREFHISKQEDGTFLIKIVKGDRPIAHPIFSREEIKKMRDALTELLK